MMTNTSQRQTAQLDERNQIKLNVDDQTIYVDEYAGKAPTNYRTLRELFLLAMVREDIDKEQVTQIIKTLDIAVDNHRTDLEWPV